jgi:hypothetical protein
MAEAFQRLFARTEPAVLSMNVQAALGPARPPKRSQYSLLVRHFLERFFNHETASPDGDAKTRLVQIACATGLPPLLVAIYLWPVYHPVVESTMRRQAPPGPPPYWLQVNHHFFFIVYSFAAMGIATVFEWDMFFPDLLDLFVLGSLPIPQRRAFLARVGSIAILLAGFLVDINALSTFVLPMAMDPPDLLRFLSGHLLAVTAAGLFSAAFILALQGLLISILGERIFRRIALLLQGLVITALVMLMLLFPVISGVVPEILRSNSPFARYFPPFWFLAIDQRILDGPASLSVYDNLAQIGFMAAPTVFALTLLTYPIAYLRKIRSLMEGSASRSVFRSLLQPFAKLLQASLVRNPMRRAIFHFISQTIVRIPRYRIYLVLYGGVGLSVVTASILRFVAMHGQIRVEVSPDGIRAAIGIVVFWMIAGVRMAFFSSGNQRGRWIFRVLHGNPPNFNTAMQQFAGTRTWVLLWTVAIALASCLALSEIAPPALASPRATSAQLLLAMSLCVILTDAFFLSVTSVPFTSEQSGEDPNLALTVLKYFTFFPIVAALPIRLEPWIEKSALHPATLVLVVIALHALIDWRHRAVLREHCNQLPLEEDEEDFPMKLGLKY